MNVKQRFAVGGLWKERRTASEMSVVQKTFCTGDIGVLLAVVSLARGKT